jgi:hypothetical protein
VASLGSATTLLVYFLVNVGALRVIEGSTVQRTLILLSVLACGLALVVWLMYTLKYKPHSLGIFIGFLLLALVVEILMHRVTGRRIGSQAHLPDK